MPIQQCDVKDRSHNDEKKLRNSSEKSLCDVLRGKSEAVDKGE